MAFSLPIQTLHFGGQQAYRIHSWTLCDRLEYCEEYVIQSLSSIAGSYIANIRMYLKCMKLPASIVEIKSYDAHSNQNYN